MPTSLRGIADKAARDKTHRFRNLFGMLTLAFLTECWSRLNCRAAPGVDRVTAWDYGRALQQNIAALVERVRQGRYRAKRVLRRYIPKGEGKQRPLGLPATEDKLLQAAVARILSAIYEPDFLPCSYGYRQGRGALDAVKELSFQLQYKPYHYLVEADIQGFFDHIDHGQLLAWLAERIDDRPFLRLVEKWLKAGIWESDTAVIHPVRGTPQGGIVSPVLAHVYLHHVLDRWFEETVKEHCRGQAYLCRYADDFVCAFQHPEDAQRFYRVLGQRLGKYGLALAQDKTRVMRFSRLESEGKTSFEFLGFELRWGKNRAGRPQVLKRTSRKRLRRSLASFTEWCKANRQRRMEDLFKDVNAQLRGHYQYYGVRGNYASLAEYFDQVSRRLFKWLNRRSQKKSYTLRGFAALLERFRIARPRITEKPYVRAVVA